MSDVVAFFAGFVCVAFPGAIFYFHLKESRDYFERDRNALGAQLQVCWQNSRRYLWLRDDCDYADEAVVRNGDELKCGEALDKAIDRQLLIHGREPSFVIYMPNAKAKQ